MIPTDKLSWKAFPQPAMVNHRRLTDGTRLLAILDLNPHSAPQGLKPGPPEWVYTQTTHVLDTPKGIVRNVLPALNLTDGLGGIAAQVAIIPQTWSELEGSLLPPFEEAGRRIEFLALPSNPPV